MTMHRHSVTYAAAVLFLPALAGVIGGELGPASGGIGVWDKALHFMAYFILSALATSALGARRTAIWAALGLIALGGTLEIIQAFIGRDAELMDEVANTLGVVSGGVVSWLVLRVLVGRKSSD
jgi:VanZ family protein